MSRSIDTWDDEPSHRTTSITSAPGSASGSKSKIPTPTSVRDDWEMDDDEEDDGGQSVDERNKQIWEDANSKTQHPMPSLVVSRGSSSGSAMPSLPLNHPPPMRILKRPSPSISPSQSSTNVNTGETLQEREARYQAARERIFGASSEEAPDNGDKKIRKSTSQSSSPSPSTKVIREPHGPTNSNVANVNGNINQENKGFSDRRTKRPPSSPATPASTTDPSDIPV